ncbi:MAG: GntR family transcriptional regulator [Verrucomicrobiae bacterium]|nr:GntR family transcriptional regulator [Verrucomicrobiae bacterium]
MHTKYTEIEDEIREQILQRKFVRRIPALRDLARQQLKAQILDGKLSKGARLPSEPQLCASLGLSRNTVRLALQELIQEGLIFREQGRGTFVAQPHQKKGRVAVVIPAAEIGLFYGRILHGIEEVLGAQGYDLVLKFSAQTKSESAILEELIQDRMTGIILATLDFAGLPERSLLLKKSKIPGVVVDCYCDECAVDSVGIDMHNHARQLAAKLIRAGSRKILLLLLSGPNMQKATAAQIRGLEDALKKSRLSPSNALIFRRELAAGESFATAMGFIAETIRQNRGNFDSLVIPALAVNSRACLLQLWETDPALIQTLRIGAVQTDASIETALYPFPVVTVKRHDREMGQLAAKTVIARIEGRAAAPDVQHLRIPALPE